MSAPLSEDEQVTDVTKKESKRKRSIFFIFVELEAALHKIISDFAWVFIPPVVLKPKCGGVLINSNYFGKIY